MTFPVLVVAYTLFYALLFEQLRANDITLTRESIVEVSIWCTIPSLPQLPADCRAGAQSDVAASTILRCGALNPNICCRISLSPLPARSALIAHSQRPWS